MMTWVGSVVHYVALHDECKAAIITYKGQPGNQGAVNLQVLYDGPIYQEGEPKRLVWKHKVPHDEEHVQGSWHSLDECRFLKEQAVESLTPVTSSGHRTNGRKSTR